MQGICTAYANICLHMLAYVLCKQTYARICRHLQGICKDMHSTCRYMQSYAWHKLKCADTEHIQNICIKYASNFDAPNFLHLGCTRSVATNTLSSALRQKSSMIYCILKPHTIKTFIRQSRAIKAFKGRMSCSFSLISLFRSANINHMSRPHQNRKASVSSYQSLQGANILLLFLDFALQKRDQPS